MSNQVLGTVYAAIIEDVLNSSRVDFEESGFDESVIDTMREVWHQKLSQLNIATFPWDPEPSKNQSPAPDSSAPASLPPPPPAAIVPPAIHNAPPAALPQYSQAHLTPAIQLPLMNGSSGTHIKEEPDLGPPIKLEPTNRESAAARAAQNLKSAYGNRATGSIQAIHRGQPGKPAPAPVVPGQPTAMSPVNGQPPPQQQQQPQYIQHSQLPQMTLHYPSQTDGVGDVDTDQDQDLDAVMVRRGADGSLNELGRLEIDRLLHSLLMSQAKTMEGGGFMVPLAEATRHKTTTTASAPLSLSSSHRERSRVVSGQLDGDYDDADDDAINSDLDDPEERSEDNGEDDDGLGHIMLCLYEYVKVDRVKNKWKCTLKDGVLTVNGKEYVFHKATGQFEW